MTPRKKAIFWVLLLIPVLVVLETGSYIVRENTVPTRIRARAGIDDFVEQLAASARRRSHQPKILPAAAGKLPSTRSRPRMFHPILGWDYPPGSTFLHPNGAAYQHGPLGERLTCTSFASTILATYGDSFTHCDEVGNKDTWQTFLAEKIHGNVLNFGVGGYGTDQAFIKYRLHHEVRTPLVALCILPENINRVVNVYPPFYNHDQGLALPKPRFVKQGASWRLFENPLDAVTDIPRLADPRFLRQLGAMDYWFQFSKQLPNTDFPFSFSLFKWRHHVTRSLRASLRSRIPKQGCAEAFPFNLWDEAEPFGVMCHVVDSFVQLARRQGSVPVIVILPHRDYVMELKDVGVLRHCRLIEYVRDQGYHCADLVQAMAALNPAETTLEAWYGDHATPEGNRIVASLFTQWLKQANLP